MQSRLEHDHSLTYLNIYCSLQLQIIFFVFNFWLAFILQSRDLSLMIVFVSLNTVANTQIENDTSGCIPEDEEEKNKFLKDLSDAKRLATHLSHLNKYRDAVMGLTRSLISEMNSYASPPTAIKSVMAATYLLLGESEATVKVSMVTMTSSINSIKFFCKISCLQSYLLA